MCSFGGVRGSGLARTRDGGSGLRGVVKGGGRVSFPPFGAAFDFLIKPIGK